MLLKPGSQTYSFVAKAKLLAKEARLAEHDMLEDTVPSRSRSSFVDLNPEDSVAVISSVLRLNAKPEIKELFGDEASIVAAAHLDGPAGNVTSMEAMVEDGDEGLFISMRSGDDGSTTYQFKQLGVVQSVRENKEGLLVVL